MLFPSGNLSWPLLLALHPSCCDCLSSLPFPAVSGDYAWHMAGWRTEYTDECSLKKKKSEKPKLKKNSTLESVSHNFCACFVSLHAFTGDSRVGSYREQWCMTVALHRQRPDETFVLSARWQWLLPTSLGPGVVVALWSGGGRDKGEGTWRMGTTELYLADSCFDLKKFNCKSLFIPLKQTNQKSCNLSLYQQRPEVPWF